MRSSDFSGEFEEALGEASSLPRPELEGEVIVAASTGAEAAAAILYLGVLHSGRRSVLVKPSEAALHFMPYRDFSATLIVFTRHPRDTRALHAVEASSTLGARTYLVASGFHEAYESRALELGADVIRVSPGRSLLTMSLAALMWVPRLYGVREERFRSEIEALASAPEWVSKRYSKEISEGKEVVAEGDFAVYYTPTGMPGAYYLCEALDSACNPAPVDRLASAKRKTRAKPIIYMAGLEEPTYRDLLLTLKVGGLDPLVINVNTDPITAGVYMILASAMIAGRLI